MDIEPKQPTRKGPAEWFTGDVYIDGKVIVARPGPAVYTPPGEEHWHGATPDSFMVHIALYEGTEDGDGATWLEHVTDEHYEVAAAPAAGGRPGRPIPPRRAGLSS